MNIQKLQSKLEKKAFALTGSYLNRSNENPESFGDNLVRSLITEGGANLGGVAGLIGGGTLGNALVDSNDSSTEAALKLLLPSLIGSGIGYAGGGIATHKLTKNKSNARKARKEEKEDEEENNKKASVKLAASADKYSSKGKKSIPFPTPKNFEATGDAVKDTDALLTYLRSLRNPKAGHAGSTTKGLLSDTAWLAGQKQRDGIRALTKNDKFLNNLKFLFKDSLNAMGMEGLTGSKYTAMKAPDFKDLLGQNILKVMRNNRKGPNPKFTAMLKNPEAFGLTAADAKGIRE